ncbi:MAG TPA: sporulation inhibitor of replication protein SirA [Bacilli bacterium]|nr:sporulation inhibitor of replication protein SirA [Bacilli bacterium]
MKEYFVFKIKGELAKLYRNNPRELFLILNRIYYMKAIDINYGHNLYNQIACFLDKKSINDYIENNLKARLIYSRDDNEHIINNLYLDEVSILTVKNTHVRIESNKDKPSFLNILKRYDDNFFVCDFKEQDYFFLKKRVSLVL